MLSTKFQAGRWMFAVMAMSLATVVAQAQDAPAAPPAAGQQGQRGGGRMGGMAGMAGAQRVQGEVTAVSGTSLTVKNEDGKTLTITTTDNTRVMKGREGQMKVADIKVGDGVMAAGNLDDPNKTLHAMMVFVTDAAELKRMKDNLGKTYITGKVTAIDVDNAKMTIERPDKVSQTIGFDESTSFKRGGRMGAGMMGGTAAAGTFQMGNGSGRGDGGESITLADIKVGDNVMGTGSVKGGVFVPTNLNVMTPGQGRRGGQGAPPAGTPPPAGGPPMK